MRKRALHNLSHYRMHTASMGQLFPIACVPVLPGDTFQHSTTALVRCAPLNTPVMHPTQVRVHHWFVPNRVVWPKEEDGGWEEFITGGPDGRNAAAPPTVLVSSTDDNNTPMTYLGVPPVTTDVNLNALPLRAYNLIFNTRYRDQDLQTEVDLDDNTLKSCAWEKDYFTTARPWSSKGAEITLPIGDTAPVKAYTSSGQNLSYIDANNELLHLMDTTGSALAEGAQDSGPIGAPLFADLAAAGQISINDFRAGFALQRYQEARSRYGSRFTEYLRYLGITPSDARLQEPEFLGGGTTRLQFSEVLQTTPGQAGEDGVGDLYGHGIAGVRSNAYRKFFEEHGFVITVMSVRPKSLYLNGAHREFLKQTKEDFFQRELANLGQQEVFKGELDCTVAGRLNTFGYQDRYDEYRQHWSLVGQDFRDTLNTWHMGRELAEPVLNESFIKCNPTDRIFQVTNRPNLWCMINHKIAARRMVPRKANPRII